MNQIWSSVPLGTIMLSSGSVSSKAGHKTFILNSTIHASKWSDLDIEYILVFFLHCRSLSQWVSLCSCSEFYYSSRNHIGRIKEDRLISADRSTQETSLVWLPTNWVWNLSNLSVHSIHTQPNDANTIVSQSLLSRTRRRPAGYRGGVLPSFWVGSHVSHVV